MLLYKQIKENYKCLLLRFYLPYHLYYAQYLSAQNGEFTQKVRCFALLTSLEAIMFYPCDDGFMSLIFSALRHTLVPVIFAFLIWFVNNDILNSFLLFASLIYAISVIPRYRKRRADFITASETSKEMLQPVKSACFSVVLCTFANCFILLLCYGLRP